MDVRHPPRLSTARVDKVYGVDWFDDRRVKITIENSAVISKRLEEHEGVRVDIVFEPDDPLGRRQWLIEHKIPQKNWWMYDVSAE